MEIRVIHDRETILNCNIWNLILQHILNRPIQIDIRQLKAFIDGVEILMLNEIKFGGQSEIAGV